MTRGAVLCSAIVSRLFVSEFVWKGGWIPSGDVANDAPARADGAPARANGAPTRANDAPTRANGAPARADDTPARAWKNMAVLSS